MITDDNGTLIYSGDTFQIKMTRYSDPTRIHLARNAARYLGKADIDNVRRPLNVLKMGHVGEIFRGEFAEFEFYDVSKEVYDHLVTYSTRNMRVAGGNRALTSDGYTLPSDKVKNINIVETHVVESMNNYHALIELGETPQVARSAMPVGAKLNTFVYQFNFLTLGTSIFPQRLWEKGAQGNTVKVVQGMYELCRVMDEELWQTFYDNFGTPMVEWKEVYRKLRKSNVSAVAFAKQIENALDGDDTTPLLDVISGMYGQQKSMW